MTTATKFPQTNLELADMGGLEGSVYFPASLEEYWEVLAEAEYRTDYYDRQIIATMSYVSDLHSHFASQLGFIFSNYLVPPDAYNFHHRFSQIHTDFSLSV
ncbi:MAG: hypothetical protein ABMA02_11365 [Saprospiraceae bacterium]